MLVEEKMKANKFLITVTSDAIRELKVKDINFLFPITGYSVGYPKTYTISEIEEENAYLYFNRIFDKESIAQLEKDLNHLPSNIKGICFTDLGVLHLIKKMHLDVCLIYMQNHSTTNFASISYYLEEVDSVLVSTDITEEEMHTILSKTTKPLVVPYFMKVDVMYSRRTLLTNFQEEFNLPKTKQILLQEPISNTQFLAIENEFGTMLYDQSFIDYRKFQHENVLFYYINPLGLTKEEVEEVLKGNQISACQGDGFLHRKTYYRLKEEK